MSDKYIITDGDGAEVEFESRAEAEEKRDDLKQLATQMDGRDPDDVQLKTPSDEDGGETQETVAQTRTVTNDEGEPAEVIDSGTPEQTEQALEELGESLGTDPLDILPGHMVDLIKGQPAVNKRGYAMIAERYGIETSAEIVELPWENDGGRCVAKAEAITEDGKEYSGWATACAEDGDMEDQLIELAETRALKRSVSWASGVGIVSYQELQNEL